MANKGREHIAGQLCDQAESLTEDLCAIRDSLRINTGLLVNTPSRMVAKIERLHCLIEKSRQRSHRRWETWCDTQVDE